MSRLDGCITVFSADGQLLQVHYAQEAVGKGSTVVGVRGDSVLVIAVEKRLVPALQNDRTERKIVILDNHIITGFAGLRADARVIVVRSQIECQSYRLSMEDTVTVEYITRYMAELMQDHTQSNGRRPFGTSFLVAGFDEGTVPRLFQTDPSGVYYEWKAAAIGRKSNEVQEYLEKNYKEESVKCARSVVKLALAALFEVLQTGQRNIQVVVLSRGEPPESLEQNEINEIACEIEREKEEQKPCKKQGDRRRDDGYRDDDEEKKSKDKKEKEERNRKDKRKSKSPPRRK